MRHRKAGRKLNRDSSHREAMLCNMLNSLVKNERIQTTLAKAKSIQPDAEKLITLAKNVQKADEAIKVNARRQAASELGNASGEIIKKLFDDIAPRFTSRKGGYTRLLKLGPRQGDNAEMVVLELVSE